MKDHKISMKHNRFCGFMSMIWSEASYSAHKVTHPLILLHYENRVRNKSNVWILLSDFILVHMKKRGKQFIKIHCYSVIPLLLCFAFLLFSLCSFIWIRRGIKLNEHNDVCDVCRVAYLRPIIFCLLRRSLCQMSYKSLWLLIWYNAPGVMIKWLQVDQN